MLHGLAHTQVKEGQFDPTLYKGLLVSTIEKIKGGERTIIILDATRTNANSMLSDPALLFTAASREKCVFVVVSDPDALEIKSHPRQPMKKFYNWTQASHCYISWPQATIEESIFWKLISHVAGRQAQ